MTFILFVCLLVFVISLNNRVVTLEKKLEERNIEIPAAVAPQFPQSTPVVADTVQQFAPHTYGQGAPLAPIPEPSFDLVGWLKQDALLKLGALLLIIAFGWFVSYAFANNWIGPVGRITLGLLAGVAFMGFGVWRSYTFKHQGAVFAVLGSTIVLLTVYAARHAYDFFTPATALGIMFLSVAFIAYLAVVQKNEKLAIAGLVLGAIAPLLTNAPEPSAIALFSYLTVLVLGSIWITALLRADALLLTAFISVVLYSLPFFSGMDNSTDTPVIMLFGFFFTVVFFITNNLGIIRTSDTSTKPVHLYIAIGSGLYATSWIYFGMVDYLQGLTFLAWAMVFATGAFLVFTRTKKTMPFYIYGAVAIGLLGAATAEFFNGPLLAIVYTLEVATLVLLTNRFVRKDSVTVSTAFLFVLPIILSAEHVASQNWNDGFVHISAVVLLFVTNTLLITGLILVTHISPARKSTGATLVTLGVAYLCLLVWLATHSVLADDFATTVSLFVYTLWGIAAYVIGVSYNSKNLKAGGAVLIGVVIARLLFIDVWQMALSGRIITFFVIGALLMSTAFLKKLRNPENN
jgi:uncharacterized membrane protein